MLPHTLSTALPPRRRSVCNDVDGGADDGWMAWLWGRLCARLAACQELSLELTACIIARSSSRRPLIDTKGVAAEFFLEKPL